MPNAGLTLDQFYAGPCGMAYRTWRDHAVISWDHPHREEFVWQDAWIEGGAFQLSRLGIKPESLDHTALLFKIRNMVAATGPLQKDKRIVFDLIKELLEENE